MRMGLGAEDSSLVGRKVGGSGKRHPSEEPVPEESKCTETEGQRR